MSMNPGSSVTSPRSMVWALSGREAGFTAAIRPFSTTTVAFAIIRPETTSSMRAALRTMGPCIAWGGAPALMPIWAASGAAPPASRAARRRRRAAAERGACFMAFPGTGSTSDRRGANGTTGPGGRKRGCVGVFMMPFYHGSRARSVPEYLTLRFDGKTRAFSAIAFATMTVFSSGISMYALAGDAMGLDIRTPIGLMFGIFGVLLVESRWPRSVAASEHGDSAQAALL